MQLHFSIEWTTTLIIVMSIVRIGIKATKKTCVSILIERVDFKSYVITETKSNIANNKIKLWTVAYIRHTQLNHVNVLEKSPINEIGVYSLSVFSPRLFVVHMTSVCLSAFPCNRGWLAAGKISPPA